MLNHPPTHTDYGPMAVVPASSPAGGYAQRRYRQGLRSWRRNTRSYAALLFGPLLALGAAGGILVSNRWWVWLAGVVFGAALGAWVAVRESPPAYIENWQTGAEGERKTARALSRLEPAAWHVVHDIQTGRGNYDHVIVGPPGVLLLDSKNPIGDAYTRDGRLWLRRRHDPQADKPLAAPRAAALADAARLHHDLRQLSGRASWVTAVTVLWCPFPEAICATPRHTLIHGEKLRAWLEAQPETLSPEEAKDLALAVERLATKTALPSRRRSSVMSA